MVGIHVAPGPLEVRIANENEAFGAWQPYTARVAGWKLASGVGVRAVRVEFRDAATQGSLGTVTDSVIVQ